MDEKVVPCETNGSLNNIVVVVNGGGGDESVPEDGVVVGGKPVKKKIMTAKKYKILASLVYGNVFLGSCYSLMAPIYPAEVRFFYSINI